MAKGSITKKAIDGIKPGRADQFLWDTSLRGFGFKRTPAGKGVFLIQYRMGGRGFPTKRFTIGASPPWTPERARTEAGRLLINVDQGIDPSKAKAERQEKAQSDASLVFEAVAAEYLEQRVRVEAPKSYGYIERTLRCHVTPKLDGKALPSIRKADILGVLNAIPAEQRALRFNTYSVMSGLFNWATDQDKLDASPLAKVKKPPKPDSRDRVLDDWELRLAWLAADGLTDKWGRRSIWADWVPLVILSGQRREEVAGIDWKELNRAAATWDLPAERAKNGHPNLIHLSPTMIAIFDRLAGGEAWPRKGLVFTTNGRTSVSGYSKAKARLDEAVVELAAKEAAARGEDPDEIVGWTFHDLRRTLATNCQRLGVRFEVTEAMINHVSGAKSGVAGIYQKYEWWSEKQAGWNAYDAFVQRVVSGVDQSNVINLAERVA